MVRLTEFRKLPEAVRGAMFDHYNTMENDIWMDCELAGINIVEKDYNDTDWSRYFSFSTRRELDLFLSLVAFEDHPSGEDWEIEDHEVENIRESANDGEYYLEPGFTIRIPRLDLYIVSRNLSRLNEIVIDDYVTKFYAEWDRQQNRPVE